MENEHRHASNAEDTDQNLLSNAVSLLDPRLMAAMIESANDAIISKNLDGIITSWNRGAEQVFGYTAQEIIGKPVLLLMPPDRQNEEKDIIARIRAGERIEHYETVRRRKDGTLIDISLTISPIRGEDGEIYGASKIARDITFVRRDAKRAHSAEERYRALFNSIDAGFCIIRMIYDENDHPRDYEFLEVNPRFEAQTGLVSAQGQTMRGMIPNHEDYWFETYGRVDQTGEPTRVENYSEVLDRWFDLYAARIGDPQDHTVAVLFTNITTRKRADHERERLLGQIETERAKLAYLFANSPAFVAVLRGPTLRFELTNAAYLQLIGHREAQNKTIREVLPEVEGQGYFEMLDRVFQNGETITGSESPVELQREPSGPLERRFVDFLFQPLREADGSISGVFVHGVDITEQVEARRSAEEANRAKDEFLAVLSHELRTPLNAILGWSRMLADGVLSAEEQPKALDAIQRNALLQAQLIEDILDVSRIITGKLRLEVQPTELADVIEAAVQSVLPAAQAKGIRLQRVLDSDTSLVSGDFNRLQQVVWNLLSNAIKFTPKGGRVQVRLERVNSHVEIIVSDSGIGIAPEVLPFVFDRFRQADSTTTRQYGGLGLGLAIVRHIVEMHGGTVEAESNGGNASASSNEGTTFTVKLPLIALRSVDVSPEKSQTREHPTVGGGVPFDAGRELEGLHAIVVDDEDDGRMLVKTVLERCGTKVSAFNNAADAFEALQTLRPDVLISDLGMPDEDGYSLIQKVRALPPEQGGQTPAAALTAYARVEDRMRVLRAGFQIHLPKPVEPAELVAVVANLCGRHRVG